MNHKKGVANYDGYYYISAGDGDANLGEPDHIYRMNIPTSGQEVMVTKECIFDDVTMQDEIEGLSFDHSTAVYCIHLRKVCICGGGRRNNNKKRKETDCDEINGNFS